MMTNKEKMDRFMKWVPLIALCVSLIALTFPVTVLYPWHLELSDEFHQLAKFLGKNITVK
jgi:hypothetical protein